jgi:hypothetical protein
MVGINESLGDDWGLTSYDACGCGWEHYTIQVQSRLRRSASNKISHLISCLCLNFGEDPLSHVQS